MQGGFAAAFAPPVIVHQDQKIGLSLAVLLIGFAGAFCFRHERLLEPLPAALEGADELDRRIEHLSIRAYTAREGALPGEEPIEQSSDRPVSTGPLADVLEIGRLPHRDSALNQTTSSDRLALFAGPPEPLRITADAAPSLPLSVSPRAGNFGASDDSFQAPRISPPPVPITSEEPLGSPLVSLATPVASLGLPDEEPAFRTYKVQPGDTLSELAQRFLGSSIRYNELYEANRNVMASPHALRAGMQLRIPLAP